jgi:hypothetical protein
MEDGMKVRIALNKQAAELGVLNHLMDALVRQVPDKERLLSDFLSVAEPTTVTAMNSTAPEEFVQTTAHALETWRKRIELEIEWERLSQQAGAMRA